MIKIDIISGFLGAGKTTLIKKLLKEALVNTKTVLIENEFGEIGIDGGFLKELEMDKNSSFELREMNSGCICCSLSGDFAVSLKDVIKQYEPEHILIEPSGVGKLSDVIAAVKAVADGETIVLNSCITVVDAGRCKMYLKNFGEFFSNQVTYADTIILSKTDKLSNEKLANAVELIRTYNDQAKIVTTPWNQISGNFLVEQMKTEADFAKELFKQLEDEQEQHVHHEHDEHCGCGCHEEHHAHQEHDEHCGCGSHKEQHADHTHHEHHDEHCSCGCHEEHHEHHEHHNHHEQHNHHEHHDHHHADDVFMSWAIETPVSFERERMTGLLSALGNESEYGMVLRAKGMLPGADGNWIHFDYVPGESDVRYGSADLIGKICVIGAKLNEQNLTRLFLG